MTSCDPSSAGNETQLSTRRARTRHGACRGVGGAPCSALDRGVPGSVVRRPDSQNATTRCTRALRVARVGAAAPAALTACTGLAPRQHGVLRPIRGPHQRGRGHFVQGAVPVMPCLRQPLRHRACPARAGVPPLSSAPAVLCAAGRVHLLHAGPHSVRRSGNACERASERASERAHDVW